MQASYYRDKLNAIKDAGTGCTMEQAQHIAARIAHSFLDRYYYNDTLALEYIDLLCEMAGSGHKEAMSAASSALFGIVIEGLCDDFEEQQIEAYNKVMSRVISYCREIPEGTEISSKLNDFGLRSADDIYARIEKLRHVSAQRHEIGCLNKIIVLSRVTIGADVAVTSVIIQRLSILCPGIPVVLIGDSKLESVFGGNSRIVFRNLKYARRGGLLDRIMSWHDVLQIVEEETKDCRNGFILIDTDSRLSQLGVFPIVPDDKYAFFNSRGAGNHPRKVSMAELANHWVDSVFAKDRHVFPKIWLRNEISGQGKSIADKIRASGCRKLISVNFGVGGNPRKRLEGDFEERLLMRLLENERTVIILDKGFGDEELSRSGKLLDDMRIRGIYAKETNFPEGVADFKSDHGIIGIRADIGEAAALISASDAYIGYDSACQHIAAAAGIPLTTIFAGTNNTRFVRRWRAYGTGRAELVHVDTLSRNVLFDTNDIIERITDTWKERN